jgi:hypothetical protein
MHKYLKQKLLDEEVLNVLPYKPFSTLIITNQRIIGRGLARIWPGCYHGEVLLNEIVDIKYIPGIPFLTVPRIFLKFKKDDQEISTRNIVFYGSSAKFAGFNPQEAYRLIVEQISFSKPK